jgi:hypothetical protein
MHGWLIAMSSQQETELAARREKAGKHLDSAHDVLAKHGPATRNLSKAIEYIRAAREALKQQEDAQALQHIYRAIDQADPRQSVHTTPLSPEERARFKGHAQDAASELEA